MYTSYLFLTLSSPTYIITTGTTIISLAEEEEGHHHVHQAAATVVHLLLEAVRVRKVWLILVVEALHLHLATKAVAAAHPGLLLQVNPGVANLLILEVLEVANLLMLEVANLLIVVSYVNVVVFFLQRIPTKMTCVQLMCF